MFTPPFTITSTIAITLIAVIIPFFTFAMSLLGNAIKKREEEERETKEQLRKDFGLKITDLENKIKTAKETGNSRELEKQLEELKKNRKKSNNQIKKIQKKHSLLNFKQSVVFPGSFLLCSILLNEIARNQNNIISFILWILAIFAVVVAIYRICGSLLLVEKVAIFSDEIQTKRMTQAYRIAFDLHEQEKEPELSIRFISGSPFQCNPSEELKIDFRVNLQKGRIVRNSEVWFFVPDEFELIDPTHYWNQDPDFVIPNIRTVRVKMGDVSKGTVEPGTVKVRTPTQKGSYFILYTLHAEGYLKEREKLEILII